MTEMIGGRRNVSPLVPKMTTSPLLQLSEERIETLRQIPGVYVSERQGYQAYVSASKDVAPFVEGLTGGPGTLTQRSVSRRKSKNLVLPDTLHPWQIEGSTKLANGECSWLMWTTGCGKTATGLAAGQTPALIVTRAMGRDVWPRDATWVRPGEKVSVILGTQPDPKQRSDVQHYSIRRANGYLERLRKKGATCIAAGSVEEAGSSPWVVIGWETLVHHLEILGTVRWETILWDESHLAASRSSQRTDAAHRLARVARRNWLLTATPVRNYTQDLWPQLRLISSDRWGRTSWRFVKRYCAAFETPYGGLNTKGKSNTDELAYRVALEADVRTRASVAEFMPPVSFETVRLELSRKDEVKVPASFGKRGIEAAIAWAAAAKLPQVIEDVAGYLLCREKVVLIGNRKVWVPEAVRRIVVALKKNRAVSRDLWIRGVTGDVPVPERQSVADEFMDASGPAVLVATIDSVSESIDLQDTDWLACASVPYTPRQVIQLIGRIGRLGGRPCIVKFYVAIGTIDEKVEYDLLSKCDDIEDLKIATASIRNKKTEREALDDLSAWLEKRASGISGAILDWEDD